MMISASAWGSQNMGAWPAVIPDEDVSEVSEEREERGRKRVRKVPVMFSILRWVYSRFWKPGVTAVSKAVVMTTGRSKES